MIEFPRALPFWIRQIATGTEFRPPPEPPSTQDGNHLSAKPPYRDVRMHYLLCLIAKTIYSTTSVDTSQKPNAQR